MMGHMLHLLRHFMHALQIATLFHRDAQFFNGPGQMPNFVILIKIGVMQSVSSWAMRVREFISSGTGRNRRRINIVTVASVTSKIRTKMILLFLSIAS